VHSRLSLLKEKKSPYSLLQLIIENLVIQRNTVTDDYEGGAGMSVYKAEVEQDPIIVIRNFSFLAQ